MTGIGATTVTAIPVSATETNFGPIVARLKNAGAQAVNVSALANIVASLQKTATAIDFRPVWMSWSSTFSESYLSLVGAAGEGTCISSYLDSADADMRTRSIGRSQGWRRLSRESPKCSIPTRLSSMPAATMLGTS
jgi:hypothetical protein